MKKILYALSFLLIPLSCFSDQLLKYEPEIVEIGGRLVAGKFEHPNGEWYPFFYVELNEPASIPADGVDSVNAAESNIREIQVYSDENHIGALLKAKQGKMVHLKGTLFHEHTAWHRRALVMNVSSIR